MKKIYKNTRLLFVLIAVIGFSLSNSGQIVKGFSVLPENKTKAHLLNLKHGQWDIEGQPEVFLPDYKSTQGSAPQTIHSFDWDVTTIWMAYDIRKVSYDNYGRILSRVYINANTTDTTQRSVYTYDELGRMTQSLHQLWNNGSWVNEKRYLYVYDTHENLEIRLEQLWQGNIWITTWGYKYIYSYDDNGNITQRIGQYWNSNNNSWQNSNKSIYIYNSNGYIVESIYQYWHAGNQVWISSDKSIFTVDATGVIIEVLRQNWISQSGIWESTEKLINIVWHIWDGFWGDSREKSYTLLNWNNGIWENAYRVNWDYDNFGGYVLITQDYSNGNWVNSGRFTVIYDMHGNFVESTNDTWNGMIWVTDNGSKDLLTYNGDDLTVRIAQYYDHITMLWINDWKEVYSDFIYVQSVPSQPLVQTSLHIYPNPSDGVFYLESGQMDVESLTLQVLNINGQVIHSQQISEFDLSSNRVDLSDYAKGVYFLKLQNNSELKTGKIFLR